MPKEYFVKNWRVWEVTPLAQLVLYICGYCRNRRHLFWGKEFFVVVVDDTNRSIATGTLQIWLSHLDPWPILLKVAGSLHSWEAEQFISPICIQERGSCPLPLERKEKNLCSLVKEWEGPWILPLTFWNVKTSLPGQGQQSPSCLSLLQPREVSRDWASSLQVQMPRDEALWCPWHLGRWTWGPSPDFHHLALLGAKWEVLLPLWARGIKNGYSLDLSVLRGSESKHAWSFLPDTFLHQEAVAL